MKQKEITQGFILLIVAALAACTSEVNTGADRVFFSGAVYMADEEHSWAEAVAIKDGEIVFVGSNSGAKAFIGSNTEVADLDGKMLMPGFHDAHAHVRYGAVAPNLSEEEARTVKAIVDKLNRRAKAMLTG